MQAHSVLAPKKALLAPANQVTLEMGLTVQVRWRKKLLQVYSSNSYCENLLSHHLIQQILMNAKLRSIYVTAMPTALTQMVASTVHAYMALKGMDSNAQVNIFQPYKHL